MYIFGHPLFRILFLRIESFINKISTKTFMFRQEQRRSADGDITIHHCRSGTDSFLPSTLIIIMYINVVVFLISNFQICELRRDY